MLDRSIYIYVKYLNLPFRIISWIFLKEIKNKTKKTPIVL